MPNRPSPAFELGRPSQRRAFASPRLSPASRQTVSERSKRRHAGSRSPPSNADFAEQELAFALDLLVVDVAGDREALLEMRPGLLVVAQVEPI